MIITIFFRDPGYCETGNVLRIDDALSISTDRTGLRILFADKIPLDIPLSAITHFSAVPRP